MPTLQLLIIVAGLLVLAAIGERLWHQYCLRRVKIRIHVNGTRGKSSVTRLIAAGLRAGSIRTVAKTTGTLPRLILPDGSEQDVHRPGRANVIEQKHIVREAARLRAEALVVECMALQPQLQSLCELKFVQATHGVITNARADHLDVMGPSAHDVASALANTVPVGATLYTTERAFRHVFTHAANDRRSAVMCVEPADIEAVSDEEMAAFRYLEHKENVALALRVCHDLGVPRSTALRGMQHAQPDPGAATTHEIDFFGRQIAFVNAFAANDSESTERAWRQAITNHSAQEKRIAIFNCRCDRPDRSAQLGAVCADWPAADHYVLIGNGTGAFSRAARKAGIAPQSIIVADDYSVPELFELVVELATPTGLVVGMGNIGQQGLDIVRYFSNRSRVAMPQRGDRIEQSEPAQILAADRLLPLGIAVSHNHGEALSNGEAETNGNGNGNGNGKAHGNGHHANGEHLSNGKSSRRLNVGRSERR